ncbi:MAG: leucine--tRNA ligase [Candidatus Micrarchaeota archaeon]|nr:leucine--tRNA ligase [Candidatus Micrarchaeota archaeon]
MAYDFQSIEKKWQDKWFLAKAFEPEAGKEKGGAGEKFFFTIPYPYVSGALHAGHGRTYSGGDVIARYKRMRGFNLLWPMGFHITGTPVLAISARIAAGDKATIGLYKEYVGIYEKDARKAEEIVKSFTEPWNVVKFFSSKLVQDFKSMGYSLDLSRQFTTGDPEYNQFISWQFQKYRKKGYLKQASYPILYCVNCKNAAGEDDIQGGDEEPVEVMHFTAFKFKAEDGAFVVSCTLRPETVFGITNMFVNPDAEYVKARVGGESWWISAQAAEKLKLQKKEIQTSGAPVKGEKFVGKTLVSPLGTRVPILPSSFVDPANASGFVHSVPAHAPYDWIAIDDLKANAAVLEKYGIAAAVKAIKPVSLIQSPGYGEFPAKEIIDRMGIKKVSDSEKLDEATQKLYRSEFYEGKLNDACGKFKGRGIAEVKDDVVAWLGEKGAADDFFETSRPAKCRCGGTVAAAVLSDQWFIDFNAPGWKERSRDCLEKMLVYPAAYKKQFRDIFDWLDKRPCARRRGLGTQLPFANEWIIESLSDSTIYMAFYTIIKKIRGHGIKPAQLNEAFFDYVFLGTGSAKQAAQATGVAEKALDEIRGEFLYWYPNDLRHTGVAHITNHLSFFIFAHTAIFDPRHWPRAVTLNEMLVCEGTKMSKSKGNVVLLNDVAKTLGADLFRLYIAGAADFGSVLDYRKKDIEAMRKPLEKIHGLLMELAETGGAKKPADAGKAQARFTGASKWFVSKFESGLADATQALEEFRLRDYVQIAFHSMVNSYERFAKKASDEEKKAVAAHVAGKWIRLLSPVIPHVCEEAWEKAGGDGFVSLAQWPTAEEGLVDKAAEAGEDYVNAVIDDARNVRNFVKIKPTKAVIVAAASAKRDALEKAVAGEDPAAAAKGIADEWLRKFVEKNFFKFKEGGIPKFDEYAALSASKDFLSKQIGLPVEIEREEASGEEKRSRAMPFKPAIILK